MALRITNYVAALVMLQSVSHAQLAPNAPADKPNSISEEQVKAYEAAIAPYIAEAQATYSKAKKRFEGGLPKGETFFVVTRLHDKSKRWEQVFIAVESIQGARITGIISSNIMLVSGFKAGDKYTFPESDVIDWLITKPDGSEEGNFVGKFLDTYKP